MKQKKIFILAAAALAFAACSSDESPTAPQEQETGAAYTQGEMPVAFGAYVDRATTRAGFKGEVDAAGLASGDGVGAQGFGVFAYYTDNKPYSETSTPNFMYNQQVKWASAETWTYSPVKYWPNEYGNDATSEGEDMLTFFAYAPYVKVDPKTGRLTNESVGSNTTGIVGMTSNTTTGDPYVKYCVDFVPANRVDLCWGVAAGTFADNVKTDDPKNNFSAGDVFENVYKPKTTSKIKFNFLHALAALNVQIDADIDKTAHADDDLYIDKKTRIWVRSVTFEGFTDKGALNLNSSGTPGWFELSCINNVIGSGSVTVYDGRRDGKEGAAIASNEKYVINPKLTQVGLYNTDPSLGLYIDDDHTGVQAVYSNLFNSTTETEPIYVIPAPDSKLKITIVYDVETWDDNVAGYLSDGKVKGSTIENKITSGELFSEAMVAGQLYTVNLHLGMTSVKFDATVEPWPATETDNAWAPENK